MAVTNVRSNVAVDPFLSFRFMVSWGPAGGKMEPAAYVSHVGALTRTTQSVTFREGGAPQGVRRIPGQTEYSEIVLQRGLTLDNNFEQWASKVWDYPNSVKLGTLISAGDFRKDIKIDLLNQAGQIVLSYFVFSCWPSSYTALPELASDGNTVALELLTLQHEGWSRDDSVKAPDAAKIDQPTAALIATFEPPG